MTSTDTTSKARTTRTITLTDRPPVRIREDEWPIVASAKGDSHSGSDDGKHRQAVRRGECDVYHLIVRQHEDGRTIVYGILDAAIAAWGQPAGGESDRGGVLVEEDVADLASRIRQVGNDCRLPSVIIRACIADLPAEEL